MSAEHLSALRAARTDLVMSVLVNERLLSELVSVSIISLSLKKEIMVSDR